MGLDLVALLVTLVGAGVGGELPSRVAIDAARERLEARLAAGTVLEWDGPSGRLERLAGPGLALAAAPSAATIEPLTRALVAELQPLLGSGAGELTLSRSDYDPPANPAWSSGTWYLSYRQAVGGVPVLGASLRLVASDRRVTELVNDLVEIERPVPAARLSAGEALERVAAVTDGATPLEPVRTRTALWPAPGVGLLPVWELTMAPSLEPALHVGPVTGLEGERFAPDELVPVQWRYLVDAVSGAIVRRDNLTIFEELTGTVTGPVFPLRPDQTKVTRPMPHLTVELYQGTIHVSGETGTDGAYQVGQVLPGTVTVMAALAGPHVVVDNDETEEDAQHRAFAIVPGSHSWDWAAEDTSPDDTETNAFYHVNVVRDYFLHGGTFDVAPLPDPMLTTVRAGAFCNAYANDNGITFGGGVEGSCPDFSHCADIIYHEYTHRVVHTIYDGAGVDLPYAAQTGAMNEGWADFYGASISGSPHHGGGCYSGRHLDDPDRIFPEDWVGEVHGDGIIFSGALWDLREALGSSYVEALALRAMKRTPVGFSAYLGAVLAEDDDPGGSSAPPLADHDLRNGSPNADAICHAYYDLHGIVHPACAGHTERPLAGITSPDPLSFNLVRATDTVIEIRGTVFGSLRGAFTDATLELASIAAPDTWSTQAVSSVTRDAVSDGVIGTVDARKLPEGVSVVRLTVRDAAGQSASAVTAIDVDRTLLAGWPRELDDHFSGTPAAVDLDRSVAGAELVAIGFSGYARAWHVDGTPVDGWPRLIGYSYGSPAVGDLDGDGVDEVVIATTLNGLHVLTPDGEERPGWPKQLGSSVYYVTPALGDLDGDGDLEIVVGGTDGRLFARHHDGSNVSGWPVDTGSRIYASPALADLDGDSRDEVVVGDYDGWVHVLRGSGARYVGWPQRVGAETRVYSAAAVGDLDGDGSFDVVVGNQPESYSATAQAFAWHGDGSLLSGWPVDLPRHCSALTSASLADIDGDGNPEVVLLTNDDSVVVLNADGSAVPGWPARPYESGFFEFRASAATVADLDGDTRPEVVAEMSWHRLGFLYRFECFAFDTDGTVLPGWPRTVSTWGGTSPTVVDLDGDGDVEVVIGADGLFVWDLPGRATSGTAEWPTYRHDARRSGCYRPPADPASPRLRRRRGGS